MLLSAGGDGRPAGEEGQQLGGLYERVAKLALDHHAAFEEEEGDGIDGLSGACGVEHDVQGQEDGDEGAAAPFPTLADGRCRYVCAWCVSI